MKNFAQQIQAIKQDLQQNNLSDLFEVALQYATEETKEKYCYDDELLFVEDGGIAIGTEQDKTSNESATQYFFNRLHEYSLLTGSPIHVAIMNTLPSTLWLELFREADSFIERNDPYREPFNFNRWSIVDADKMTAEELQSIESGDTDYDGRLEDNAGCYYYLFSKA